MEPVCDNRRTRGVYRTQVALSAMLTGVHDDEPLPIKFGPASNGEFLPPPHSPVVRETIRRTHALADRNARRLGISRRQFLSSVRGAAATLFVLAACSKEEAADRGESPGGTFDVSEESTLDTGSALDELGGEEFIFDVQGHYVNQDLAVPGGGWTDIFPFANCAEGAAAGDSRACFTVDAFYREMFVRSDTSMVVLSSLASPNAGLDPEDMVYAIDVATRIGCDGRVLMQGGAFPHRGPLEAGLQAMSDIREQYDIVAWKIYTITPTATAFYFDDHDPNRPQIGQRFIDHVREIGPPVICAHKGMSQIGGSTPELADPSDVPPAAVDNPDISFVVYHSGHEVRGGGGVGPYDPDDANPQGVDRLVRSLQTAGLEPNSNVYAELGGTWWVLMRNPTAAAHVLGKLLTYVGEDRVVWGTDSIWFGTPQDQIQALRTFEISEELQERHGYPALTDEIKAKIFGLNSAALYDIKPITGQCDLSAEDLEVVRASLPPARTYGPSNVREAAAMIAAHQAGRAM
jgi:predicted TIM-barrel fold metal-dependent hydrolase